MKKREETVNEMEEQVINQDENTGKEEVTSGKLAKAGAKGAKVAANVLSLTASGGRAVATGGKAVANGVSQGARELAFKLQNDAYRRKLKKYNPLFPWDYESADFFLPNIICIVDDAVRRDIDVCKGAIGWREQKGKSEVLCLYDEFVPDSGLTFVPTAVCDAVYYVDAHDRKRFIKYDCIFQQAHDEKVAELEHIAYSLGAKRCIIEFGEIQTQVAKKKKVATVNENVNGVEAQEHYESSIENTSENQRESRMVTCFKGNDIVTKPRLKWFEHDSNILNLIEYRCNGVNEITSKTMILNGSASATMSLAAACSIDAVVAGYGVSQNCKLEESTKKESKTRIKYILEF